MHRTYTTQLKVTRKQDENLHRLLAQLCELYNMALQQKRDIWKSHRICISRYEQQKQLTELRGAIEEYAEFPATIQRDPLRRLDRAFNAFFRRMKNGDKAGFPRFRNQQRYDSFSVNYQNFRLCLDKISITRLGSFKIKTRCKIRGTPLELRVMRCGNKWQAQIVCDIGPAPDKASVCNTVGIDMGLTALVTLSDGTEIANPHWTKQEEDRLANANRSLGSKRKGSNNRRKSKERLRRVHQNIAGKRRFYLHRISHQLIETYDLIAYEDLKIAEMAQSRFGKGILDAAWGELIHQLKYKAECAGKYAVAVDPRGTTQMCSGCGEKVPKGLKQRAHNCPHCGLSLGRDHNAALNVLRLGESLVGKTQNTLFVNA
jgi:putative transposase